MQRVVGVAIETEQGMITGTLRFLGIVAHPRPLNSPAVQGKDGRIQIQNETGSRMRKSAHLVAQSIVDPEQALKLLRMPLAQEIPQAGIGRKAVQPQETLKGAVVSQDASVRDSLQACDHAVDQAQEKFGLLVGRVAMSPGNVALKESLQSELSTKLLKKQQAAVMSKGGILE